MRYSTSRHHAHTPSYPIQCYIHISRRISHFGCSAAAETSTSTSGPLYYNYKFSPHRRSNCSVLCQPFKATVLFRVDLSRRLFPFPFHVCESYRLLGTTVGLLVSVHTRFFWTTVLFRGDLSRQQFCSASAFQGNGDWIVLKDATRRIQVVKCSNEMAEVLEHFNVNGSVRASSRDMLWDS
jgi:hypothetical protein